MRRHFEIQDLIPVSSWRMPGKTLTRVQMCRRSPAGPEAQWHIYEYSESGTVMDAWEVQCHSHLGKTEGSVALQHKKCQKCKEKKNLLLI